MDATRATGSAAAASVQTIVEKRSRHPWRAAPLTAAQIEGVSSPSAAGRLVLVYYTEDQSTQNLFC